jgi:hypothetical protein
MYYLYCDNMIMIILMIDILLYDYYIDVIIVEERIIKLHELELNAIHIFWSTKVRIIAKSTLSDQPIQAWYRLNDLSKAVFSLLLFSEEVGEKKYASRLFVTASMDF